MADDPSPTKTAWVQASHSNPWKKYEPAGKPVPQPDRPADTASHAPTPKMTYEMPGPLGNEVRRTTFVSAQDRVKRSEDRKAQQAQSKKPENDRSNSQKAEKERVPGPTVAKFRDAAERNR